jgi:hypothetical protein
MLADDDPAVLQELRRRQEVRAKQDEAKTSKDNKAEKWPGLHMKEAEKRTGVIFAETYVLRKRFVTHCICNGFLCCFISFDYFSM